MRLSKRYAMARGAIWQERGPEPYAGFAGTAVSACSRIPVRFPIDDIDNAVTARASRRHAGNRCAPATGCAAQRLRIGNGLFHQTCPSLPRCSLQTGCHQRPATTRPSADSRRSASRTSPSTSSSPNRPSFSGRMEASSTAPRRKVPRSGRSMMVAALTVDRAMTSQSGMPKPFAGLPLSGAVSSYPAPSRFVVTVIVLSSVIASSV